SAELARPEGLLRRAERTCGLGVEDSDIRQQLLRILRHVLIPRVVLERIIMSLESAGVAITTVGEGWERWPSAGRQDRKGSLVHQVDSESLSRPLAAVFAGADDPLGPDLLRAASLGWPLLLHNRGGAARVAGLADVLRP